MGRGKAIEEMTKDEIITMLARALKHANERLYVILNAVESPCADTSNALDVLKVWSKAQKAQAKR